MSVARRLDSCDGSVGHAARHAVPALPLEMWLHVLTFLRPVDMIPASSALAVAAEGATGASSNVRVGGDA